MNDFERLRFDVGRHEKRGLSSSMKRWKVKEDMKKFVLVIDAHNRARWWKEIEIVFQMNFAFFG